MTRKQYTQKDRDDRTAEIKAIHEDLERKISELTTSQDWIDTLNFAAKFHTYSLSNVLWLQTQASRRGVTLGHVAGYRAWEKLGRHVKCGEKSFKVLAPARYPVTDEATGEKRWVVRGFTFASVFDVSQTDGDPIPDVKPVLLTEGGELGVLAAVIDLITDQGFGYELVGRQHLGAANGVTYFDETLRKVQIRDDVEVAQRIKTSVHELAHIYLHAPEQVDYSHNQPRCEVEAESVAYVVLTHLGVVADDYSLPYVAGWARGDTKAVRATAETVIKTAHRIIEALTVSPVQEVAA